jgi:hypothetical protein
MQKAGCRRVRQRADAKSWLPTASANESGAPASCRALRLVAGRGGSEKIQKVGCFLGRLAEFLESGVAVGSGKLRPRPAARWGRRQLAGRSGKFPTGKDSILLDWEVPGRKRFHLFELGSSRQLREVPAALGFHLFGLDSSHRVRIPSFWIGNFPTPPGSSFLLREVPAAFGQFTARKEGSRSRRQARPGFRWHLRPRSGSRDRLRLPSCAGWNPDVSDWHSR